jgi:hypothetical protein
MAKQSRDSKSQALQQQGALHPHPEQVTDELFVAREFFDPRDVIQVTSAGSFATPAGGRSSP